MQFFPNNTTLQLVSLVVTSLYSGAPVNLESTQAGRHTHFRRCTSVGWNFEEAIQSEILSLAEISSNKYCKHVQ